MLYAESGIDQYDRLTKKIEGIFKKGDLIKQVDTHTLTKLLHIFAQMSDKNFRKFTILDKLMLQVEQNFDKLEEKDVLTILRAYEFLEYQVVGSGRVFSKLTSTVAELAIKN